MIRLAAAGLVALLLLIALAGPAAAQTTTTTTPPPKLCVTPGPATLTEEAACDTATELGRLRAEVLLGLVLVVLLAATIFAVTLWR